MCTLFLEGGRGEGVRMKEKTTLHHRISIEIHVHCLLDWGDNWRIVEGWRLWRVRVSILCVFLGGNLVWIIPRKLSGVGMNMCVALK